LGVNPSAVFQPLAGRMSEVQGPLVLAVRAARRAIRANPNDPDSYLNLADAYRVQYDPQRRDPWSAILRLQQITALHQALARLPLAEAQGRRTEGMAVRAHEQLRNLYLRQPPQGQRLDLGLEEMRALLRLAPWALAGLPPEQAQARVKALDEQVKGLEGQVKK